MNNSALLVLKSGSAPWLGIVYEVKANPLQIHNSLRRAIRNNRGVVREHIGKFAFLCVRHGPRDGWLVFVSKGKSSIPHRYRYEIDIDAKVPLIRIMEYANATGSHAFGKILHLGPLFAWLGADRMQTSLIDRRKKMVETVERRKRLGPDLLEIQQRNDAALRSGTRNYTESELRLRSAIEQSKERDRRAAEREPYLTGRDRPMQELDDEP